MTRPATHALLLFAILCAAACGPSPTPSPGTPAPDTPAPASAPAPSGPRIVFLGDSLTAGLGLNPAQSYPSLIGQKLKARGYDYEIVNAGISGDTSAGGLRRVDWSLEGDVRLLVVALGGNDALRGLPDYTAAFRKVYTDLAKEPGVRFIPFLLDGVAGVPGLNQADGIHPNPRGAQLVADLVWKELEPALPRPTR